MEKLSLDLWVCFWSRFKVTLPNVEVRPEFRKTPFLEGVLRPSMSLKELVGLRTDPEQSWWVCKEHACLLAIVACSGEQMKEAGLSSHLYIYIYIYMVPPQKKTRPKRI